MSGNFTVLITIKENGCYECVSLYRDEGGRPHKKYDGKTEPLCRVAYKMIWGEIPENLVVRHKCDNPACINPLHLDIGSHFQNVRDRVRRKRSAIGENNGRAKLTPEQVIEIYQSPQRNTVLAKKYDVDKSAIRAIKKGLSWRSVTENLENRAGEVFIKN